MLEHLLNVLIFASFPATDAVKSVGQYEGSTSLFLQSRPQPWQTSQVVGEEASDSYIVTATAEPEGDSIETQPDDPSQRQGPPNTEKTMLLHLAAINQKIVEEGSSAGNQFQAPPGQLVGSVGPEQPGSSPVLMDRPHANGEKPDTVQFGLYGKIFYGLDLKHQEFSMDTVMTLQWKDLRVVGLVPNGEDELTLTAAEAAQKLWMPQVEILKTVARSYSRIASSVTVVKDGTVTQVERSIGTIKNKLILNNYPFDEQLLRLSIASTKYMLDEVELKPMDNDEFTGLRKGFFDGEDYESKSTKLEVHDDIDGSLKKSRGSLDIFVTRSLSKFHRNFLIPAILYLCVSCAVFWLPFSPTFVTPRVALSIIILLLFSNVATTADSELPSDTPYNWIDLMCYTIQLNMFAVVCLNIFTEVAYHSLKCTISAEHISQELRVVAPMLAILTNGIVLIGSFNPDGTFDLEVMTILVSVCFWLLLTMYMSCCVMTLRREQHEKQAQIQAFQTKPAANVPDAQNMGPIASSESLPPSAQ